MAIRITTITRLLSMRKVQEAVAEVIDYETVVSTDVRRLVDTKLLGTVLHISKQKQITYQKSHGSKKVKVNNTYHRLVFCREHTNGGKVFAIIFREQDRHMFALSPIVVGGGIIVVQPQAEGEWVGIAVVSTPEPLLPCEANLREFLPSPFPDLGFTAFYIKAIRLQVVSSCAVITCSGKICRGLYGGAKGQCPCVQVNRRPRHAIMLNYLPGLQTVMDSDEESEDARFITDVVNMHFEPFISPELTEAFVASEILEAFVQHSSPSLDRLLKHVKMEIQRIHWDLMGWWIGSKSSDPEQMLTIPKCHVVQMKPQSPIRRFREDNETGPGNRARQDDNDEQAHCSGDRARPDDHDEQANCSGQAD